MRRWLAVGLAVAALAACGRAKPPAPAPDPVPEVRIALVSGTTRAAEIEGVGTVALRREASLGFTSAGRIARISVNEGDRVRAGQVLAALDTTTVAADLARAQAERDRAAAEYKRSSTLIAQGWITRPRLENAKASLEAAEAQVRAARFQASTAAIVAPGHGTVLARLAEPGQVIAAGTPVLVIGEAASGLVLRVPLSDRDAARIRPNAPAVVTLAALDAAPIRGHVVEIGGRADRATGAFTIEIALPADPRLRSGQIGNARIFTAAGGSTAPLVPAAAIFSPRAGAGFAYVVDRDAGRVHLRRVTISEATDAGLRVTAGLKPGEWVATSRVDRLKDGMRIRIIGPAR